MTTTPRSPAEEPQRDFDVDRVWATSENVVTRTRRDRRGRGLRGLMFPPFHPAYRTRRERFDEAVVTYVSRLELTWGKQLKGTEFAVEEVPPSDPSPWETGGVPLGRYFPPVAGQPGRVVIYRRPIEARAQEPDELSGLVRDVILENIAFLFGCAPDEIDGDYQS
ncbi:metallopeptidase family protein [Timonella sp. A28]|uniref:metallopeptidase family protein n=1 Tax=Timonella sp. A28 TaxID=3442640 RepID=UPI003EB83D7F